MIGKAPPKPSEGLKAGRLLMVLSSFSPLFILWAVRGNKLIPDAYFIGFCVVMVVIPNAFLLWRIRTAKKQDDRRELVVGSADDHRDDILVYLFAMLLPFYPEDLETCRYFVASLCALAFVVFLFWHLNLHYMNLLFALRNYRVFTLSPPDDNPLTGNVTLVLITHRLSIKQNDRIIAYRLSDTVYLEA